MDTFTKKLGTVTLAALTILGVAPPRAEAQINPLFQVPFGVNPYAFRRPGRLGFTPLQFAYQTQVIGQAFASVPPYALGYGPSYPGYVPSNAPLSYPDTSLSMAYGNPYMPVLPAYTGTAGTNPYMPVPGAGAPARRPSTHEGFRDLLKDDGNLAWPLALRVLPPALETKKLREQVQAAVLGALDSKDDGKTRAAFVQQATRDIDHLRELLNQRADEVPLTDHAVIEGRRFLTSLKTRLQGP